MITSTKFKIFLILIFLPSFLFGRYYNPRTSTWMTVDPILIEYLPKNQSDFDTDHDYFYRVTHSTTHKLKGYGGVFNPMNLNLYHYAGNNPVKYVDPDGRVIKVGEHILPYEWAGVPYRYDQARGSANQVERVAVTRGWQSGHPGVDSYPYIAAGPGRGNFSMVAVADGVVKDVGFDKNGYGKYVLLSHGKDAKGNEITTLYAHLSKIDNNIKKGVSVSKDQAIGKLGNTPNSDWHSHYEIRSNGKQLPTEGKNVEKMIKK